MEILTYLENLNWPTMAAMFIITWYFTRDIKASVEKLENDMREQGKRTDKLYEMFCDLQKQMKDEIISMKKEQYDFMKDQKK